MITFASIVPHPPIIIPEIGSDETKKVKKTISALFLLNDRLKKIKPDTIIVISPHGIIMPDRMTILKSSNFEGSFSDFGCPLCFKFKGNLKMAKEIEKACQDEGIPLKTIEKDPYSKTIDHGILTPLYYLCQGLKNFKIQPIYYSFLDREAHLILGRILYKMLQKEFKNESIAIVASGDLSHRLTFGAPAGYTPLAKKFDQQFVKLLKEEAIEKIAKIDPFLVKEAGECGLRSFLILFGILENLDFDTKILSYEGPFGVGYLVADFLI